MFMFWLTILDTRLNGEYDPRHKGPNTDRYVGARRAGNIEAVSVNAFCFLSIKYLD